MMATLNELAELDKRRKKIIGALPRYYGRTFEHINKFSGCSQEELDALVDDGYVESFKISGYDCEFYTLSKSGEDLFNYEPEDND